MNGQEFLHALEKGGFPLEERERLNQTVHQQLLSLLFCNLQEADCPKDPEDFLSDQMAMLELMPDDEEDVETLLEWEGEKLELRDAYRDSIVTVADFWDTFAFFEDQLYELVYATCYQVLSLVEKQQKEN